MPGRSFQTLAKQWLENGVPETLPCAVISRAAQPEQTVQRTTLHQLGSLAPQGSPSLLIAGWALAPQTGVDAADVEGLNLIGLQALEVQAKGQR